MLAAAMTYFLSGLLPLGMRSEVLLELNLQCEYGRVLGMHQGYNWLHTHLHTYNAQTYIISFAPPL